jgi:CheY-like chemotaxis protein
MLPLPQALTASCSDEERARCAAAGMVELVSKPINLVKVQARMCCVVARRPRACIHRVC